MTQQPSQQPQALAPVQQPSQTAIAQRASATPLAGSDLSRMDEALQWAKVLADSTIIPKNFQRQPANVFAAILLSQELGLSPMLVMRDVYMVNDRPVMYAELKIALVRRSPIVEYITCIETTPERATWEAKRRGAPKPVSLTVTMDQIPGGLKNKDTWKQYPANMLRWRCGAWLCDMEFSDLTLGIRTADEMEDVVDARPTASGLPATLSAIPVTSAPVAQQQTAAPAQPKAEEVPPHDPVTGEVVDEPPAKPAEAPPAKPQPPAPLPTVDELLAQITAAKTGAELDALKPLIDKAFPKSNNAEAQARRNQLGRAMNAQRAVVNGAGR